MTSTTTMNTATSDEAIQTAILAGRIVPGMTFNQQVWAVTARIPRGQVVTYSDIAHALGTRAYRAVGSALNKNPYAPRVPCHRVVGRDGSLTGFAGGLEKKRKLLEAEGVRVRRWEGPSGPAVPLHVEVGPVPARRGFGRGSVSAIVRPKGAAGRHWGPPLRGWRVTAPTRRCRAR